MSESAPILSSPSSSSSSSSTGNSLLPGSDLFRMSDAVVLADGVHAYLHSQGPKPHANLDWQVISKRMSTLNTKRLTWTAEHCCMLWKYLAYGIWLKAETVLSYESDEEDYYFSPEHADFKYKQHQVSSKTDNPVGFQRDISRKLLVPEVFRESSSKLLPHTYSNVLNYSEKSCQVLNRFKIAESLNHRSWALYKAYPSIFNVDNNSKKRKLEEGVRKETSTPKPAVPLTNTAVLPIASPIVAVTSKPKLSISKPKSATTMPNNDAIISSKQQGSGLSLKQKSVEAVHNPPTAPAAPATTIAPPIPTSDTFTAKPVDPLTQLAEAAIKAVELPVVQETVAVAAEQSKQQVEAAKECKEVISFDQDDSSEANVDENEDGTENAATTTPAAVLGSPIDNTVEVNEVQQPL